MANKELSLFGNTSAGTSPLVCSEEVAYMEIKKRILDGRLAPGNRLVHRNLAKELGMSPNPVVPALRMLERDGLVVNTPGLGACVRQWTMADVTDLSHIRAFQEALAARLCAERAAPGDLTAIRLAHESFRASIDNGDTEANIQADVQLHLAVVRGAKSRDLERIIENLAIMQCSMKAFALSLGIPRQMAKSQRDVHVPLIRAIEARDSEKSEYEGRRHVEESLKRNITWLEQMTAALDAPSLG